MLPGGLKQDWFGLDRWEQLWLLGEVTGTKRDGCVALQQHQAKSVMRRWASRGSSAACHRTLTLAGWETRNSLFESAAGAACAEVHARVAGRG